MIFTNRLPNLKEKSSNRIVNNPSGFPLHDLAKKFDIKKNVLLKNISKVEAA